MIHVLYLASQHTAWVLQHNHPHQSHRVQEIPNRDLPAAYCIKTVDRKKPGHLSVIGKDKTASRFDNGSVTGGESEV
jgi:hypothetical protein